MTYIEWNIGNDDETWFHVRFRGQAIRIRPNGQMQRFDDREGIWYNIGLATPDMMKMVKNEQ